MRRKAGTDDQVPALSDSVVSSTAFRRKWARLIKKTPGDPIYRAAGPAYFHVKPRRLFLARHVSIRIKGRRDVTIKIIGTGPAIYFWATLASAALMSPI
jgi:hypothetical protein